MGYPWHALREACYSDFADRLVMIDYDLLTTRPQVVFPLLYQFIEEEPFEHNFVDVEYDAPEFDNQLGLDGLHRVHRKVAPRPRRTILPPDLFNKYAQLAFWHDLPGSPAYRIVPEQPMEQQHSTRCLCLRIPRGFEQNLAATAVRSAGASPEHFVRRSAIGSKERFFKRLLFS